jgi:hypothetical protein
MFLPGIEGLTAQLGPVAADTLRPKSNKAICPRRPGGG